MKRAIGVVILTLILLTGCNLMGSIFEPIIGSWETTILGVDTSFTFNADGTATEINSLGQYGITRNGTWDASSEILTLTWEDESVDEYSYSFNSDKSEMTLAPYPDGISITYSSQ